MPTYKEIIVTFIGHSDISFTDELKNRIKSVLAISISKGANTFYCGGCGKFDVSCAETVKELKKEYSNVLSFYVTLYLCGNCAKRLENISKSSLYDGIIYPPIEMVPYKFAILKRNEWMIDRAEIIIAFVNRSFGGAYASLKYAKRKKKTIINLA